jgi:toxin ParE1/3/4
VRLRLVWTQHALADRDAIFEHLESDSPRAAVKVDERILAAVRLLEFPESARPGPVAGTRELVFPHTPF